MSLGAVAAFAASLPPLVVPPVTPSTGAGTPYTLDTASDVGSYSFTHVRGANSGTQVSVIWRTNANPSPTVASITADGVACTIRAQSKQDGASHVGIAVATIDPGVGNTGSQTILITLSGSTARDAVAWATDITDTTGAQQGVAETFDDAGTTSASVNITPANAASLLLGVGGCLDGTGTVTAGAAWTGVATQESANDVNAVEARKPTLAPDTTAVTACDVTFSAARTMRAIACVEWLPS